MAEKYYLMINANANVKEMRMMKDGERMEIIGKGLCGTTPESSVLYYREGLRRRIPDAKIIAVELTAKETSDFWRTGDEVPLSIRQKIDEARQKEDAAKWATAATDSRPAPTTPLGC